jgi:phospholipid-binding lipoprotein MlaA
MLKFVALNGLAFLLMATGCASTPQHDPLEGMNRAVFAVNDTLDTWIAKPVAKGYRKAAPGFVEVGVSNFFDNLGEFPNVLNDLLQAKWGQAGHDSVRLVLNTFAGLGGLVDVAAEVGLEKSQGEDFAQTLRKWGVPAGPYLVLPILGPSTLTDAVGIPVDWVTTPSSYLSEDRLRYGLTVLNFTDKRANLLDAEGLISGEKYVFYREAYLQNRAFMVSDGAVKDDFGGELDDFEEF